MAAPLLLLLKSGTILAKALSTGERWITVRPNGPGTEGHPLLIKDQPDGSAKVIGGAGGSMNHLRLTSVRSEADYKSEAASRAKLHKETAKRRVQQDKKDGLHENKTAAREALKDQLTQHEATFVKTVSDAMGWKPEELRFPAEKFQSASPAAQEKAEKDHARKVFAMAQAAVDQQRKRLVQDADARAEADLGEVRLVDPSPESLSVQDLDPVQDATKGLGFAPNYDKRAEAAGATKEERREEAATSKPTPKPREPGAPDPAEQRKDTAKAIADELEGIRDAGLSIDPSKVIDAKKAVELLKAQKTLKAVKSAAKAQKKEIDSAKAPIEPKAFQIETVGVAPDEAITKDLENDLRTMRTRGFLDEAAKMADGETIGRHVAAGAYNSVNALALAAGGAALLDRSTVDVLGIAGAAKVLARRLANDLTPEELEQTRSAMGKFHVEHYMGLSDQALREARSFQEMASEIELGHASDADDLARAQEMNAKRREFVGSAQRVIGTALGEMEANAALVVALEQPKKDKIDVSLGRTSIESAITQARAIGLQRGEYQVEKIGSSTMLTVTGAGMDRLAQPINRADLARTRDALDIIEGRKDEDDWLPAGVTRRPEGAMNVTPGTAPRLAKPFAQGGAGDGRAEQSIRDYIGGRAADGDAPAEILAGLLDEDTLQRAGNRGAFMEALDKVAPLYGADGKMVRAEDHASAFEAMAEQFAERTTGGRLQPIHRQQFKVDQGSVDALHQALAAHPDGVAAFKPIADLSSSDQRALRRVFGEEFGRTDPAAEGMRADLEKLKASEPTSHAMDMFGESSANPDHTAWKAEHDDLAGKVNAATMDWGKYLAVMGSPANAYAAMQDVVRSKVLKAFADAHNRGNPGGALKVGRTVIQHDLNHLDALDSGAREQRLTEHRDMVDRLRNRVAGRYAAGTVGDKLDAARAADEAAAQSQMGLFGAAPDLLGAGDGSDTAPPADQAPKLGQRYTIGHAAERQVAGMMPIVGKDFRPGRKVDLWSPSMSGKYVGRQRAVKLIRNNKRTMLGLGTGSGKTSIMLSAFTDLKHTGDAKRGLFVVPSIVQGQFHGEALTLLEPGKFNWHADPGASRDERIKALKDPNCDFNVVTHQAFRDDILHMAAQQDGTSHDAVAEKLEGMKPEERAAYVKGVLDKEGIDHDYMAVDEGHTLLNRAGKENSRMANVLDGVAHSRPYYVSATADPVKNDASEAFDVLAKMDPARYSDRDAFMRRYGVNTAAAKDGLRREMARHFYTGRIDPGVKATKHETSVQLEPEQHARIKEIDAAASWAKLARMAGKVDLDALRTLSPGSFRDIPEERHQEVGEALNKSIGIVQDGAVNRAVNGAATVKAIAKLAQERKGKQGVVFAHQLDHVDAIAARLKADGHRVVTLSGKDSSAEKDRKKAEFQDGQHDVIVMSDAGAVGANLQKGKWLAQADTPPTAMVHAQRNGRIHRIGQKDDVDLHDFIPDHVSVRRARKRLENKYELRDIMTSPLEGLDDHGIAGMLSRVRAGETEAKEPVHAPSELDRHQPEPDQQGSLLAA